MLLFISDLHLSTERPAITRAFYRFLETTAKPAQALYILGDFFDVWLGDDDDTPLYQEVIQALKHYQQQGAILYFMRGNRDFLVGKQFAQQTGAILLPDPSVIIYQQQALLLMHGDSLCTKDTDYMHFRAMARSEEWQQQLLSRPLSERRHYAAKVRQHSTTMNSLKAADIMDVTEEEVIKIMSEQQVKTLIHGHTHRPNTHQLQVNGESAQRIVLGDWGEYGWYASIEDTLLELHQFKIE